MERVLRRRRALDALRQIVQALRVSSSASERALAMSGAQLFVLRQIATAGTCSVGELATRTLTHPSSVSVVVSRLVRQGLGGAEADPVKMFFEEDKPVDPAAQVQATRATA